MSKASPHNLAAEILDLRPPDSPVNGLATTTRISVQGLALGAWVFARRHRRVLLRGCGIFFILGVGLALLIPAKFTARATILPPESNTTGLSRLLAALPIGAARMFGASGESKMIELYVDIARSQTLLSDVLNAEYLKQTFRDELRRNANTPDWQLIERIQRSFAGSKHPRTQLVMFELSDRNPQRAAALLNEILKQMDLFFRYRLATNENLQRKMIEARLTEVADTLRISEEALRAFKERNRTTFLSANLMLEEGRLRREVEINNALYIELTKQLELARINEAETAPVLNVLDYATPPQKRSGPSRKMIVLSALLIGAGLVFLYVQFRDFVPPKLRRFADRALAWQHGQGA